MLNVVTASPKGNKNDWSLNMKCWRQFLSVSIRRGRRTNQEQFTTGRPLGIDQFPFSLQMSLWTSPGKTWFQDLFLGLFLGPSVVRFVILSSRTAHCTALPQYVARGVKRERTSKGIRDSSLILASRIPQAHHDPWPLSPAERCWPKIWHWLSASLTSLPLRKCWHHIYNFYSFSPCKHTYVDIYIYITCTKSCPYAHILVTYFLKTFILE